MSETEYTLEQIEEKAQYFGEFMLVLESDREYDFHNFTVTMGPTEVDEDDMGPHLPPLGENELRIQGMHEDEDGEMENIIADIPVGRIEHVYAHREA